MSRRDDVVRIPDDATAMMFTVKEHQRHKRPLAILADVSAGDALVLVVEVAEAGTRTDHQGPDEER